ncbi:TATA-binding protein-associated factor 2N [Trichinella zimbabwensis]|uniref:TATA-binding protein-associated factor 2N n=1 Tax=Trichinella zimbabwensis TaxID=268475 RepID=A0A0V1I466_9BILA|nr:TATA-binding protein-associated factor 2N [Trichinella zimbabwensis]
MSDLNSSSSVSQMAYPQMASSKSHGSSGQGGYSLMGNYPNSVASAGSLPQQAQAPTSGDSQQQYPMVPPYGYDSPRAQQYYNQFGQTNVNSGCGYGQQRDQRTPLQPQGVPPPISHQQEFSNYNTPATAPAQTQQDYNRQYYGQYPSGGAAPPLLAQPPSIAGKPPFYLPGNTGGSGGMPAPLQRQSRWDSAASDVGLDSDASRGATHFTPGLDPGKRGDGYQQQEIGGRKEAEKTEVNNTVFVQGIPDMASAQMVAEYFGESGEIMRDARGGLKVHIYKDKASGKLKGEALVCFMNNAMAANAIDRFHGNYFPGSDIPMQVSYATSRASSGSRGGYGRENRYDNRPGRESGSYGGGRDTGSYGGGRDSGNYGGGGRDSGGYGGGRGGGYGNPSPRGCSQGRFERGSGGPMPRGNMRVTGGNMEARAGDWICQQCSNSNFAFRTECNKCKAAKPVGECMPPSSMGDLSGGFGGMPPGRGMPRGLAGRGGFPVRGYPPRGGFRDGPSRDGSGGYRDGPPRGGMIARGAGPPRGRDFNGSMRAMRGSSDHRDRSRPY